MADKQTRKQSKILMVGAGAVGQAYGYHLSKGGYDVTYLIKPKYEASMQQGLAVACLNAAVSDTTLFQAYATLTDLNAVEPDQFDQVWFCIDSTALTDALIAAVEAVAGQASVVTLQPGLDDYQRVVDAFGEHRVIRGMITLVSFDRALVEPSHRETMCWWFPPLSRANFSGSSSVVDDIVRTLNAGEMPAKHIADVALQLKFGSGILMPLVAALEEAGWTFRRLREGARLCLVSRAARQMIKISMGPSVRLRAYVMTQVWLLKLLTYLAPRFTPFDLERVLQVHFTKVGAQTRVMLARYIELGRLQQNRTDAIQSVLESLDAASDRQQ